MYDVMYNYYKYCKFLNSTLNLHTVSSLFQNASNKMLNNCGKLGIFTRIIFSFYGTLYIFFIFFTLQPHLLLLCKLCFHFFGHAGWHLYLPTDGLLLRQRNVAFMGLLLPNYRHFLDIRR